MASPQYWIEDLSGTKILGRRYPAALSLSRPAKLCCDAIRAFVADGECPIPIGLLGMDALRQVVTVFQSTHGFFQHSMPQGGSLGPVVTIP
jgi:hypothetical protein